MKTALDDWQRSVESNLAGGDIRLCLHYYCISDGRPLAQTPGRGAISGINSKY